jgi:hypothetical protein
MEVYHNPEDDHKELQRLQMKMKFFRWFQRRWEEIKSIWGG